MPGVGRPAVRDLTLDVREGEIFGLLGPNGAGKSTTQNLRIPLFDGYRGRIVVLGRELQTWDARQYYRMIWRRVRGAQPLPEADGSRKPGTVFQAVRANRPRNRCVTRARQFAGGRG